MINGSETIMYVRIGPYKNWITTYKFFDQFEKYIGEKWCDFLSDHTQTIVNACWNKWGTQKRKVEVRIDDSDVFGMNHTLSYIILPMLKMIKDDKQGAPYIPDEDVPEHLKSTAAPPKENDWDTDDNHFKRWDHVLDCMIWSFQELHDDFPGEEETWTQKGEIADQGKMFDGPNEDGNYTLKWKTKPILDKDANAAYHARLDHGFLMFGKHFTKLWT
tara:strand:- start:22520 stop:23170 length:651 start_codon:yes stop_codon:yes gene_type:complete